MCRDLPLSVVSLYLSAFFFLFVITQTSTEIDTVTDTDNITTKTRGSKSWLLRLDLLYQPKIGLFMRLFYVSHLYDSILIFYLFFSYLERMSMCIDI